MTIINATLAYSNSAVNEMYTVTYFKNEDS